MTIILKNGTVFEALGEAPILDDVVTIEGSRIGFVGTRTDFERTARPRHPTAK